jgi:DNA-binding GntR family transcriptional regulator
MPDLPKSQPKGATKERTQTIYQAIRERICLLQYPPGSLLKEGELAAEFGVSRTPIRRVLHRLEFEGLVVTRQGIGSMVIVVDVKYLREVYALRLRLVELMGELSPRPLPQESIVRIQDLSAQCEQMVDSYDLENLGRLYNTFHTEILHTIGNDPLRNISDQLYYQTSRVWLQILPDLNWNEEVKYVCEEIKEVIDALQAGDMKNLAQIRRKYMAMLLERTSRYLGGA